jgi:hypothetical protein
VNTQEDFDLSAVSPEVTNLITNLLPLIILITVWFIVVRPLARAWEKRIERRQGDTMQAGQRTTVSKSQFIWKIGVKQWGGFMFLTFAIGGPLIPHFTMGKPLTIDAYVAGAVTSALVCFPGGALFGWLMWHYFQMRLRRDR